MNKRSRSTIKYPEGMSEIDIHNAMNIIMQKIQKLPKDDELRQFLLSIMEIFSTDALIEIVFDVIETYWINSSDAKYNDSNFLFELTGWLKDGLKTIEMPNRYLLPRQELMEFKNIEKQAREHKKTKGKAVIPWTNQGTTAFQGASFSLQTLLIPQLLTIATSPT